MSSYFFIASEDPYESRSAERFLSRAQELARSNDVFVFLVQNAVLPAKKNADSEALEKLSALGVPLLADSFSLQERGIPDEQVKSEVTVTNLDVVLDHLVAGAKVIWH